MNTVYLTSFKKNSNNFFFEITSKYTYVSIPELIFVVAMLF